MNRAVQAGEEGNKVDTPPGHLGNTYEIDTSKYVEFISDEEWKKKKKEENAKVLKDYLLSEK